MSCRLDPTLRTLIAEQPDEALHRWRHTLWVGEPWWGWIHLSRRLRFPWQRAWRGYDDALLWNAAQHISWLLAVFCLWKADHGVSWNPALGATEADAAELLRQLARGFLHAAYGCDRECPDATAAWERAGRIWCTFWD